MAATLRKGERLTLQKSGGRRVDEVLIGLGWRVRQTIGHAYDLDASAFALDSRGRVPSDQWFVFYNQLTSPDGRSIVHTGDDLVGGDGSKDDEQIAVSLAALPEHVVRVAIAVSIHDAESRGQNFGQVRDAFVRVVDTPTGAEITRYDLTEDAPTATAMVLAELARVGSGWEFRAVGAPVVGGLYALATGFGVEL